VPDCKGYFARPPAGLAPLWNTAAITAFSLTPTNLGLVMPEARYFVSKNDDVWIIKYQEEEFGPYISQAEAMMFAIEAAEKLGKQGVNPEVCLVGENGHFRTEWTYAPDASVRSM
jgi:hypothetical protein